MNQMLCLLIVALTFVAAPCLAQSTGTISENESVMEVKSAVALFDATEPVLRVVLLPFQPTAEEISKLQARDTMWILDKKSPDAKKWPEKSPFAYVELSWSDDKKTVGDPKTAYFYMLAYSIGKPSNTNNVNKSGKDVEASLTGPLKVGQEVALNTKGSVMFFNDKVEWNLKIKEKLLAMKKK